MSRRVKYRSKVKQGKGREGKGRESRMVVLILCGAAFSLSRGGSV